MSKKQFWSIIGIGGIIGMYITDFRMAGCVLAFVMAWQKIHEDD